MTRRVVVDVGNSRAKWGLGDGPRLVAAEAVPFDDPAAWQALLDRWQLGPDADWIVSGVQPDACDKLMSWLEAHGFPARRLTSHEQLPLKVSLPHPRLVGIDRLLNAVAVNRQRQPDEAAVIVDAGSAVTIDLVDDDGAFRGGAILPGFRLMSQALHDYTSLLPLVKVDRTPPYPGQSTADAIQVGIFSAVVGAVERTVRELGDAQPLHVFFTGGDGSRLADAFTGDHTLWPTMTLEGLLHSLPHE